MLAIAATIYAIGLIRVAGGNSVAARDPRRFWLALVLYPVVAIPVAVNSLLNKL